MMLRYPNLELLDYKARIYCSQKLFEEEWLKNEQYTLVEPEIFSVFKQEFANTARAFEDGKCVSGQAFTDCYMSVFKVKFYRCKNGIGYFKDYICSKYVVFCDDRIVYTVSNPNRQFFHDVMNYNLLTLQYAQCGIYEREEI